MGTGKTLKIGIVYWSGSGNTEKIAQLVGKGAAEAGADVTLKHVSDIAPEEIGAFGLLALGSPAMGDEGIEESEMEPFVSSIMTELGGKRVALFGSYGWGDGEWIRKWAESVAASGAEIIEPTLTIKEAPEGEAAQRCADYGQMLANLKI